MPQQPCTSCFCLRLTITTTSISMPQALMALAEQTECDVRSCLHTLQFLSRRQRTVRPADIDGARVGQKDITKNAFAAWQELFWLRVSQLPANLLLIAT